MGRHFDTNTQARDVATSPREFVLRPLLRLHQAVGFICCSFTKIVVRYTLKYCAATKNLKLRRMHIIILLSAFLATLLLSSSFYSYRVYRSKTLSSHRIQTTRVSKKVNQALTAFDQFLKLLAYRIGNNKNDTHKITMILNTDFQKFYFGPLPTLMNLEYHPVSNQKTNQSRLEVIKRLKIPKEALMKDESKWQMFTIQKSVRYNNSILGTLKAQITLANLIPSDFKQSTVADVGKRQYFSVTIAGAPILYVLDVAYPSFLQFLKKHQSYLLVLVCGILLSTLVGGPLFSCLTTRRNKRLLLRNKALTRKTQGLSQQADRLDESNLQKEQKLLQLEVIREKREQLLFEMIKNYQTIGSDGKMFCDILLETTSMVPDYNGLLAKIKQLAEKEKRIFHKLAEGHFIKKESSAVDIDELLEEVLSIFANATTDQQITVTIDNQVSTPIVTDTFLLKIVLHNLMSLILERYLLEKQLYIEVRQENGLFFSFTDNGKATVREYPKTRNILNPNKASVTALIQAAGWNVTFTRSQDSQNGKNNIKLWLPDHGELSKGKVVPIFRDRG
ncbi:MAG: hypothetical protein ABFQ95_05105 [Pseudomonadota bacterium]